ncbi:hypothetical protein E2C01_091400 [Portunus trituberculatus]|uniref:Uncharacterized protein n=1 Tax=Portunus trituberculatus TaxID=210409 RepID=A0A5B7JSU1_PORTR|nr:hypothetical protein [Portunus trituberculatus]
MLVAFEGGSAEHYLAVERSLEQTPQVTKNILPCGTTDHVNIEPSSSRLELHHRTSVTGSEHP